MAIYKLSEVLNSLKSMAREGYEYIELSEVLPEEDDDDDLACLNIDAIISCNDTECDIIDAVKLPKNYHL